MNLLLLSYNNYYNRIVKQENTLSDYAQATDKASYKMNVDFNPADGVSTDQVINWNLSWTPDYLICYEMVNNEPVINSRWFILEFDRIRGGQYNANLRRDVVVDNYDAILDADMFIEKAIPTGTDVAIYNTEDISFNEIKQSEQLIKDKTGKSYIVGYFAENTPATNISFNYDINNYKTVTSVEGLDIYEYLDDGYKYVRNSLDLYTECWFDFNSGGWKNVRVVDDQLNVTKVRAEQGIRVRGYGKGEDIDKCKTVTTHITPDVKETYMDENNLHYSDIFSQYENKYILVTGAPAGSDYPNGLYLFTLEKVRKQTGLAFFNEANLRQTMRDECEAVGLTVDPSNQYYFKASAEYDEVKVIITRVAGGDVTTTISDSAITLKDAPYKMFCMPVDDINFALKTGSTIISTLGSYSYDVQLLPFCPILDRYNENTGDFTRTSEGVDYSTIYVEGVAKAYIYYCDNSRGTFNVDFPYPSPLSLIDKKISNQCDKYRLCSPNYAAMFDFNLNKTDYVDYLNIDYTYKPYSPYIHINPIWHGLYGRDYDDCRGLICQGDFSIPATTDEWRQYEINNKNYLNAFNREVESIELQNKVAAAQDIVGAVSGTLTGAAAGAAAGKYSGLVGAGAGALIGGITSALGGAADVVTNRILRNDALDLRKDQFNYNLQNIQALPYSLSKVSSFVYNNKIFPIIEYYSCTDQEKEIFINKLRYNGMKIERIDTISNFIDNEWDYDYKYFKGQLIRIDVVEDSHMIQEIADELYKGVYI